MLTAEMTRIKVRDNLERYLMVFEPYRYLPKFVKSTRDIYENRSILKQLPCTDFTIGYLAQIVLADIEAGKRFRRVECLKVCRAVVRNSNKPPQFKRDTARVLFQIYKGLIFEISEDGQWAASVLIKGQILDEEEIQWLIKNYQKSVHVLNRLLLYPERHPAIVDWAEQVREANEFPDREVEVLALLIQDDVPPYIAHKDSDVLLEAIARARVSDSVKETLLKSAQPDKHDKVLELALRLRMPSLIQHMIETLESGVAA